MPRKILMKPSRRSFLQTAALSGTAAALTPALAAARDLSVAEQGTPRTSVPAHYTSPFDLEEITIADLQDRLKSGEFTARLLVEKYWVRVSDIDMRTDNGRPVLNSVIEMNPDALSIADALDRERKEKGPRGPLHGIPVLIKDNIATDDRMMTTAGSLAMVGAKAPKDSFVA